MLRPKLCQLRCHIDLNNFKNFGSGAVTVWNSSQTPSHVEVLFPALIKLELHGCEALVEFPEVHEAALPQLQILDVSYCKSLEALPLSLEVLTSLRKLFLEECHQILKDCCRKYCVKSAIWSMFDIEYCEIE
jgi:hypothetical protein